MESAQPTWTAPIYDISKEPKLEDAGKLAAGEVDINFARYSRWCPDGSVALAQCEDATFQYLDISPELTGAALEPGLTKSTCLPQPAPILDFAWYPYATTRDVASFCFVASVRETPVKLLDAADGRLRASYKIVDHRERQIAPHSLAFNMTATKLYCGFEDAIEVFDVHIPGEGTRLHITPSKKSRDGLKGIVSSLAFSSDAASGVYAAGTLSPSAPSSSNIALFSESTGEVPAMFVGDERPGGYGVRASVNQLKFNPFRPYLLYASFRRHDTIYSWDLRGGVTKPVQTFGCVSGGETNQRLRFDIDIAGSWLGVGDYHGGLSVFDLNSPEDQGSFLDTEHRVTTKAEPKLRFKGHDDAVGSVSFHPLHPLLLSVSGSRHYPEGDDPDGPYSSSGSSDEEEDEGAEVISMTQNDSVKRPRERPSPTVMDTSFKLWSFDHGQVQTGQARTSNA